MNRENLQKDTRAREDMTPRRRRQGRTILV